MDEMRPYPEDALERLQDAERSILGVVDALCRENGIDYFIDSGTGSAKSTISRISLLLEPLLER